MRTYQVRVYRDPESPRWWLVEVPELRVLTQARRLAEAADMARDLIAIHLDVPIVEVDVEVRVDLGPGLEEDLTRAAALRASAADAEREASAIRARVAQRLAADGVAVRDIGALLGVSFQRAHQLLGEHLVDA